jgi:hypothetical protein
MFGKGRIDTEAEPALSKQGAGFLLPYPINSLRCLI